MEHSWCEALECWVQVLERKTLFGQAVARVVPEGGGATQTVPIATLKTSRTLALEEARAAVAGARIAQALGSELFLSPLLSNVQPLPHQWRVLRKLFDRFPVRQLLADEVGMGKTIEAGLAIKELKLRGLARRILVLAPKSLLLQWILEMETLFSERFELVLPGQWGPSASLRDENPWSRHAQIVTSYDSVKPKDSQRGWSADRLARYNLERFHDLVGSGFDLVICDEAHKAAGVSEEVGRYELVKSLARTVPHFLLLTATPHSGKSDAFRRLLTLLDPEHFGSAGQLTRDVVTPFIVRTEKRTATDVEGKPLFAPRTTRLITVPFGTRHAAQKELYDAVSAYVVEGYKKAERGQGGRASRLLLVLLQRLVSSSTRAICRFLEQRAEVLRRGEAVASTEPDADPDADPEETLTEALFAVPASNTERADVERLLALAVRVEALGPDARAEALYENLLQLAQDDGEPGKKFLIFTEFTATQELLAEFLKARGYTVALLNGAMEIGERRAAVERFRGDSQVLICTDAGGEGLNMQFAHVVLNYDLPWNPMRVEQRIGRVDRIGQTRPVKALNFVLENSVEARLYDIWQVKLATILAEFGVDKTGDVLDSGVAGAEFERLARTALIAPDRLDTELSQILTEIREAAVEAQENRGLFTDTTQPERPPTIPLQAWLQTFQRAEQGDISLSERIISQVSELRPYIALGQPVPSWQIEGLGFSLDGWFALWKVGIAEGAWRQQQVFALFVSSEGARYARAAQRLWEGIAAGGLTITQEGETLDYPFAELESAAEEEAERLFTDIVLQTQEKTRRLRDATDLSFLARRAALAPIEPESVRESRRRVLESEHEARRTELAQAALALPELQCLFLALVRASE